jgi:exodeoxyribonuclease V alpha subunit
VNDRNTTEASGQMLVWVRAPGSKFPAVVIPLATQHYILLQRKLIYTGITRGKRLLVLVGQRTLGITVPPQRRHEGH